MITLVATFSSRMSTMTRSSSTDFDASSRFVGLRFWWKGFEPLEKLKMFLRIFVCLISALVFFREPVQFQEIGSLAAAFPLSLAGSALSDHDLFHCDQNMIFSSFSPWTLDSRWFHPCRCRPRRTSPQSRSRSPCLSEFFSFLFDCYFSSSFCNFTGTGRFFIMWVNSVFERLFFSFFHFFARS